MSEIIRPGAEEQTPLARINQPTGRRTFLKWTGVSAAAIAVAACEDTEVRTITEVVTDTVAPPPVTPAAVTLDFSDDFGVLNYAYALEQLEAAFYIQVASNLYSGATEEEVAILLDLRDHEVAHREFYAAALGDNAIGALTVDFSAIDFSSRESVLTTARTFEDLGVRAYNGAGPFLSDPDLLTVAGKIVSVEARHASAIRDLLNPNTAGENSFAPNTFDEGLPPADVLEAAGDFIVNEITLANVPS